MTVRVRPARPADAQAIIEVRLASWRATYGPYLPEHVWDEIDRPAMVARHAQRLRDGAMTGLVADEGGGVRAFTFYGPCRDDDLPGAGEIYSIYVHPDHLSTGLGRALMAVALDTLVVRPVVLWVLENNARARRFYEIAGFRPDGTVKPADLLGGVQLPEIRYRLD